MVTPNTNTRDVRTLITASHCCVCRKGLEDAESVQLGIGPVCSRRYYDPSHTPTETDVLNAMGLLHKGVTEGKFPSELIDELRKLKDNARQFSNCLVLFTSANYDKRGTVLACADIIRTLGYNIMADKLEVDRVKVRIVEAGDNLLVHTANVQKARKSLSRIPGAACNLEKEGHKIGWTIPKDQEEYLMIVLGIHFGRELMVTDKGISAIRKRSYYDLRRFLNPPRPAGPVTVTTTGDSSSSAVLRVDVHDGEVSIDIGTQWLRVRTPYYAPFKDALKDAIPYSDRKWEGCWLVKPHHLEKVKALVAEHYGVNMDPSTPESGPADIFSN
jgi:hypothetical protein